MYRAEHGPLTQATLFKGMHQGQNVQHHDAAPAVACVRFDDLPVAQLRTTHKDPEVAAGLAQIAKLDEQLREASLKVGDTGTRSCLTSWSP